MPRKINTTVLFKKGTGSSSSVSGILGDVSVSTMIRNAVYGTDWVDIVVVGDSNAAYGTVGWGGGLEAGLHFCGASLYGTGVMLPWLNYGQYGIASGYQQFFALSSQLQSDPNPWVAGSGSAASSGLKASFAVGTGADLIAPNNNTAEFAYLPSGQTGTVVGTGNNKSSVGMYFYQRRLDSTGTTAAMDQRSFNDGNLIGVENGYTARILLNAGSGSAAISGKGVNAANSTLANVARSSGASPTPTAWEPFEVSIPAAPYTRSAANVALADYIKQTYLTWQDGFAGGITCVGPLALGMQSAFRKNVPGAAVNLLHYRGGATLTNLATAVFQGRDGIVSSYLKEVRERQISAGGQGKVVICINGGVNNSDWVAGGAAQAVTVINAMINNFKTAWENIGGAVDNLKFMVMPSHPIDANDATLAPMRTAVINGFSTTPNVVTVNLNEVASFSTITAQNWYFYNESTSQTEFVHLSPVQQAYEKIGTRVIQRVCAHGRV